MSRDDGALRRRLTRTAAAVGAGAVVLVAAVYLATAYYFKSRHVEHNAEMAATGLAELLDAAPDRWPLTREKLADALAAWHGSRSYISRVDSVRILYEDRDDLISVDYGEAAGMWPVMTRSSPIRIGGRAVGHVVVATEIGDLYLIAAVPVALSLILAIGVFYALRILPMRALAAHEELLRERERYYRSLIENSTDIISVLTADGTVGFQSRSLETQLGYARDELIGINAFAMVHPDDLAQVGEAFRELLEQPDSIVGAEFRFRHKDGSWRVLDAIGKNALDVPGIAGMVINSRDVTRLKEQEEQLRQAQKVEAVGQLTGGVAHDFNNLLTVVLGNLDQLDERVGEDPAARRSIAAAIQASERGAQLTQRLLAFSRKQPLRPRVVDVNALIEDLLELLTRTLAEDVEVATELRCDWPAEVDPNQLENAILNIAVNARDAMPGGGRLTLRTGNVTLDRQFAETHSEVRVGDYVELTVGDTGEGMQPDVVARAFDPFFTTKPIGVGSGLGLSMVYGFAKQSGGHADIESAVGWGTTIKLYLPRAPDGDDTADQTASGAETLPTGNETVLVVEDDAEVRSYVATSLSVLGYRVFEAADASELESLLDRMPGPDLLVTDVILPGAAKGPEIAARVTARYPDAKTLFISGYAEDAIVHHGRLDDGIELLTKPFRRAELASRVRVILDRAG